MSNMNLPFPHADRRTLKSPPIELIIAQARFPTLADLYGKEGFIRFASAIRDDYPRASPDSQLALEITPDQHVKERGRIPVWRFEDLTGKWTLTLTPDFLALETRQYHTFPEFRVRFHHAWKKLADIHKVTHRTRLGLRYVDRFSSEKESQSDLPANWIGLVEPTVFPLRSRGPNIPQAGTIENRFLIRSDLALTFRASFRTKDFENNPADEVVLDLDAYDATTTTAQDVEARLDDLKELTHNAFWWVFGRLLDVWEPADAAK